MPRVLFAGDVHLRPGAPDVGRRFLGFLRGLPGRADRLVLLGDIFDYWIGPKHLDSADYREALDALREVTAAGLPVDFLHGNRDYFVEERFARRTGVRVAGAELRLELGGRAVHCAHGDFIYNRNPKYTAYRRIMSFRGVRAAWLAVPAAVGKSLARGFKKVSRRTTPSYSWGRGDLDAGARPYFGRGADVLIVGHIHRPTHLAVEHEGRKRDLFIVGDWDGAGEVVEFDGSGFRLVKP